MAKRRSGCHKTKERSEVKGSTRKIYKQKGTGQARHGAITAPIFVGGGIVFGPRVRSHGYSLNKKIRNLGLKVALSLKLKENSLIVLDKAKLKVGKSTELNKRLKALEIKSALFVDISVDENLKHSSANLLGVDVLPVIGLNVLDILQHQKLILTTEAVKKIEERLAC
jgi:large subunit ribosomal protein L4